MSNIEKIEYIFGEYDEYVGFSRKNKEWNTFTHFVRFLKSSKNKNNVELQQVLTNISLLTSSQPVEIKYTDGTIKLHNEFIFYLMNLVYNNFGIFSLYTGYSSMKDFYYSNSILKYALKNICTNNITEEDFKLLLDFIAHMKKRDRKYLLENDLFDVFDEGIFSDYIKHYTTDKTFRVLQKQYSSSK